MVKWSFNTRFRRASCTVWIVALLPLPWKARRVGFGASEMGMPGGCALSVKKGGVDAHCAMQEADELGEARFSSSVFRLPALSLLYSGRLCCSVFGSGTSKMEV